MTTTQPLPVVVHSALLGAVRQALYYRDDLKQLMISSGVPRSVYARCDDEALAKVQIARRVLDELHDMGTEGWAIQRRIVVDMSRMQPGNGVRHRHP